MTQQEFATKYLKKSQGFWALVLAGKRRLEFDDAEVVSQVLGTGVGLWASKEAEPKSRQRAWKRFQQKARACRR